jgi:NADH-quinone oxidoreductase subunit M
MFSEHILSWVIWLPIVGGALVLLVASNDKQAPLARMMSLVISLVTFVASIPLYMRFDSSIATMQYEKNLAWIDAFNIRYHIGIDGISLLLVLLTTFTTIIVIIAGWQVIKKRVAQFMAAFLIMEGLMIGVFSSLDAMLFYVFWEAMLIPMFLIIGIWGGPNRVYAAIKFFLYTFIGSVLMLVAFLYLYYQAGQTFELSAFYNLNMDLTTQTLIFFAFFAAFAVKVPMWPVHTWLPDAHVEAPTGGSVILAAIMLKLGAYGFLRFSLPITPLASQEWAWLMIALSLVAVVYIGLVALVQKDMKKLIAYSSIAHMGFVTLGFFIFNVQGIEGGIVQMVSHGFISGALFLCVGVLYDRMHTREISDYEVANDKVAALKDINPREALFLGVLALAVLIMGLWPYPFLDVMHVSVENLLQHVAAAKAP